MTSLTVVKGKKDVPKWFSYPLIVSLNCSYPLVTEPNPLRTLGNVLFPNTALAPPVASLLLVYYQLL